MRGGRGKNLKSENLKLETQGGEGESFSEGGRLQTTDSLIGSAGNCHKEHKDAQREKQESFWRQENYTQMDLCAGERWPFGDKEFDLGLSSHCLEDLRDPVQVVKEMGRVCKRVLIICPSRLFEQMRGGDHPNYSGMMHHPWLVYEEGGILCFRRKTQLVEFPGNHLICPVGRKLKTEYGCFCYYSDKPVATEVVFFEAPDDAAELRAFVDANTNLAKVFEWDASFRSWRKIVWYLRQRYRFAL